jgi:hypothetical protein
MSTFQWQGDVFPFPPGFQGLSVDDWYLQLERINDRVMNADELDLPEMVDADGDPLDPEEVVLIKEFGFRTGGHFEAFKNWSAYSWAQHLGEDPGNLMIRMSTKSREIIMNEKMAAMRTPGGGGGGALDPVEGVSLETWAAVQAAIASGGNAQALCAQAGIDDARWQRVSAEWNNRMSTDTTATVATAYGNAFASAGTGQFGGAAAAAVQSGPGGDPGAEPVSFERFIQVQEAMGAATQRGEDPNATLAQFGMTAADFGNLGAYWNKKMQSDAMTYHQQYSEFSAKYRAMYGGS